MANNMISVPSDESETGTIMPAYVYMSCPLQGNPVALLSNQSQK
jgi:hypothetical protein